MTMALNTNSLKVYLYNTINKTCTTYTHNLYKNLFHVDIQRKISVSEPLNAESK